MIAHFAKVVRPGSVRVASTEPVGLPNAAFRTPEGKTATVIANTSATTQSFAVNDRGHTIKAVLQAGAVGTYIW